MINLLSIRAEGIQQGLSYQLNSSIYLINRQMRFNARGDQILIPGLKTFSVFQITPTAIELVWSISVGTSYDSCLVFSDFSRIYPSMSSNIYRLDSFNGSSYSSSIEIFPPRSYNKFMTSDDMKYLYLLQDVFLNVYTVPNSGEPLLIQQVFSSATISCLSERADHLWFGFLENGKLTLYSRANADAQL